MMRLLGPLLLGLLTNTCATDPRLEEIDPQAREEIYYDYFYFSPYYYDYFPGIWYDHNDFKAQQDEWFYDYSEQQFRRMELNEEEKKILEEDTLEKSAPSPRLRTY